jgi:hypothetical protein
MINVEQDRQSAKESITALPILSSPAATSTQPKEPSRLRHGSVPNVLPTLKKRTSLQALKRLFQRSRSAGAEPRRREKMVDEKSGKEDESPKGATKKTPVLEDLIELPG